MTQTERAFIGFMLRHCLFGMVAATVLAVGILWTDVGQVGTLIASSGEPILAFSLLLFGLFVTFGSVSMGVAVFMLGEERDDPVHPRDRDPD